jgi:GH25 family lysozyme M1 (1,4-beta-N-acetylmuramidase)
MGKLFNINKKSKGTEPKDSGLADFEKDIVSLDETGSIELPDDYKDSEETEGFEEAEEAEISDAYEDIEDAEDFEETEELEEAEGYEDSDDSEYYDEVSDETGVIEDSDADEETEDSEYYDEVSDETGVIEEIDGSEEQDDFDETGVIEESGDIDDPGKTRVIDSLEEIEYPDEVTYDEQSEEDEISDQADDMDYRAEDEAYDYAEDETYDAAGYEEERDYDEEQDDIRDDDPTLGFDEVRLDTASINAAELAAYVQGKRIRELRQSGALEEGISDKEVSSKKTNTSDRKSSGKEEVQDENGKHLGSDEYVNLDESHDIIIDTRKPDKKNNILKLAVIAAACIALLAAGIFGVSTFLNRGSSSAGSSVRMTEAGIPVADELIGVGSELNPIGSIGRSGLDAALNARMSGGGTIADVTVPDTDTPTPHTDYNENELVINTRVSIELITVKSDLKIRFINAETGKLIPNIPFQVIITDPSGKTLNWTDDDLDGIIYKTSISEGKYKVHVEPLSGDKYSDYSWPSDNNVTVKSTIDYARVDVESEVKDASQVNENAEDTASRGNTSAIDLTNTVEFVESTVAPVYTEISKDTITNPLVDLAIDAPGSVVFVTDNTTVSGNDSASVSGNGNSGNSGNSGSGTVSGNGDSGNSGNSGSGSVSGNGDSGNSGNSGSGTVSGNGDNGSGNGNNSSVSGNGDVSGNNTPAPKPGVELTLSPQTLSLKTGGTGTFTINWTLTNAPEGTKCNIDNVVSSNTTVATFTRSDKTVTVTAVAGGTCDITVTVSIEKNDKITDTITASAKCTVTVTNVDMTQLLKDKSGNEVYVFENNAYRQATFADYAKFDKFYIITGTKYTGWQTINGSTYYYDVNGKVVTGTQVIQGVTYMFGADGKMTSATGVLGIDVSKWNGNIDWAAVKASGVDYVIIRVGYRGSTAGALIDDSRFVANINGAKGAGLKVGVYFVTQAINDVEAVYEASMVLDRIKGYSLELPVFLDVEPSGGRGDRIDKATRTSVIIAFCETIRSAGYAAGVYANKSWLDTKMNAAQLSNYKIWVAHYSSVCGYTGRYDMWQYSDKGTIPGISGSVDLNLRYS